jgi:hypothetical protein
MQFRQSGHGSILAHFGWGAAMPMAEVGSRKMWLPTCGPTSRVLTVIERASQLAIKRY